MNLCEKLITKCIGADCDNPIFTGLESKAYIFNKSEIASFTYDEDEPNLITGITMKTYDDDGSDVEYSGYTITQIGKQPYTGTNTALVEGNVSNKFTETLNFVVPDNSPTAAAILDNIANGRFVVIVANEFTGSDGKGKFQCYGVKKGLVATSIENDKYSEDTDGGWSISLSSENAPNSSLFIQHLDTTGDTPVDDTESYLDSLVSCE